MHWNDYLTLSEELALKKGCEASQRSAVSRAYYSLYNQAKDWYKAKYNKNFRFDDGSHKALWEALKKEGAIGNLIANTGEMLRKQRNQCDYEKTLPASINIKTAASTAVNLAKSRITDIGNLP